MFDIVALVVITIFIPVIIICGVKLNKNTNISKITKVLAIVFLLLELFRFFYNASIQPKEAKAAIPSGDLTFTYLSFMVVISLFGTFNKGKFGYVCQIIFNYTILVPIVLALFNNKLYYFPLDTFAVLKALYFIEVGIVVTLYILNLLQRQAASNEKLKWYAPLLGASFVLVYAIVNFLTHLYWDGVGFELMWLISMLISAISVGIIFLAEFIIIKIQKKNIHPVDQEKPLE